MKTSYKMITPDEIREIMELYHSPMSLVDIEKKTLIGRHAIARILREKGYKPRTLAELQEIKWEMRHRINKDE